MAFDIEEKKKHNFLLQSTKLCGDNMLGNKTKKKWQDKIEIL
jgi:hypothetical protein